MQERAEPVITAPDGTLAQADGHKLSPFIDKMRRVRHVRASKGQSGEKIIDNLYRSRLPVPNEQPSGNVHVLACNLDGQI
jgi:hypothetical protein